MLLFALYNLFFILGHYIYGNQQNAPSGEHAHFVSPIHLTDQAGRLLTFMSYLYTSATDTLSAIEVKLHSLFNDANKVTSHSDSKSVPLANMLQVYNEYQTKLIYLWTGTNLYQV